MPRFSPYAKGLFVTLAEARGEVRRLEQDTLALQKALAQARSTVAACEALARQPGVDKRVFDVAPLASWQGRYGRRGDLQALILSLLEFAYPSGLDTAMLASTAIEHFGLSFPTAHKRNRWRNNSVRNSLLALETAGKTKNTGLKGTARACVWLFVPPKTTSIAEIKAAARAANVPVTAAHTERATPEVEGA